MPRGDALARQLHLIRLLDGRRELAVDSTAQELGISRRTLYRDLDVLQRSGVPLYTEPQGKRVRWRLMEGQKAGLRVTLSWAETLALAAAGALASSTPRGAFSEAAAAALDKVRAALPEPLARRAELASRWLSAHVGAAHDYRDRGELVQTLALAIERSETVTLAYRKPGERTHGEREVDPYHLHVQAGALYLIGYCHRRRDERIFLVDRASKIELTGKRFERRPAFAPQHFLHGGFGPWAGKPRRVQLRFAKEAAPFALEREMHPTQRAQWRADGSLDVTFETALSPPLVAWVVSWGPRVEVVSPVELARTIAREHEEAIAHDRGGEKKANA